MPKLQRNHHRGIPACALALAIVACTTGAGDDSGAGGSSESSGAGDSSGPVDGASDCEPAPTGSDPCGACILESCCVPLDACLADEVCACVSDCIEAGGDPFAGCPSECGAMGTNEPLAALSECQFGNCSTTCMGGG
jgi:hypothetical protein